MNTMVLNIFVAVSLVLLCMNIWTTNRLLRRDATARWLGASGVFATVCVVTYFVTVFTDSVSVFAWMTTVHLIAVAIGLFCAWVFSYRYVRLESFRIIKIISRILVALVAVDIIVLLINPFKNIVLEFALRTPESLFSKFIYAAQYPLYYMHMAIAYLLIVGVLLLLGHGLAMVPKEFGRQFLYTMIALAFVLVFNIVSVFVQDNKNFLNYSIGLYSILPVIMYVFAYKFSDYIKIDYFKDSVFENVSQSIVLFDFRGEMVMCNSKAVRLFSMIDFSKKPLRKEFEKICNIVIVGEKDIDTASLQCFVRQSSGRIPLRCDFRRLKNEHGALVGYLYVFADIGLETDPVTGYQEWDGFKNFVLENSETFALPLTVIVSDINNLSVVNSVGGRTRGDQMLKAFAHLLRKEFVENSYFVRGEGANLVVLAYNRSKETVAKAMESVSAAFGGQFLYATEQVLDFQTGILQAIETASKVLRQKKLLDTDSKHSEILETLKQALLKNDSRFEEHVAKMQKFCDALAPRLDLTERQLSDLKLLCTLHDVGKVAIPVEILQKPAKLTREEYRLVQSHVEKGYQIAKSSKEFVGIADYVRHHHERWDGTGYPDGISRESIPLLSRIIAVLDSYDAMTSPRPYRAVMPKEYALNELRSCAGTQFDPTVVAEFLQVLSEETEDAGTEKKVAESSQAPSASNVHVPSAEALASMKDVVQKMDKRAPCIHRVQFCRCIVDAGNKIVSVDENFEGMTGYSREDIRQMNLSLESLIPPEDLTEYLCATADLAAKEQVAYFEHRLRCRNGSVLFVFGAYKVFYDSASRENRCEVIIADSSSTTAMTMMARDEQVKAARQLRQWEDTYRKDSLTGLLNRSAFQSDVEEKLLDSETKVMLLMIDVDNFKNYNDTYGHRAGDEYLVFVANTVRGSLRDSDLACRMGGDEFAAALFFKKENDTEFMHSRARQIFDRISNKLAAAEHPTGLSMGAVVAEHENMTFKQVYEASDKALYKSKKDGRGRLSVESATLS